MLGNLFIAGRVMLSVSGGNAMNVHNPIEEAHRGLGNRCIHPRPPRPPIGLVGIEGVRTPSLTGGETGSCRTCWIREAMSCV